MEDEAKKEASSRPSPVGEGHLRTALAYSTIFIFVGVIE
jgi:hypothetical protein